MTPQPAVALLPWGNVLEEFLDPLNVPIEAFSEFRGSWMFGYAEALRRAGVRTVLICMSARVSAPRRMTHSTSGATLWILPASRLYRTLRRRRAALYFTTPLRGVAATIRREKCSAVLCQEYEYPRFDACVLLGRWLRLPVFATFQGGNYQRLSVERVVRPLTIRASAGLIIPDRTEAARVMTRYRIPPAKIRAIFNAIDVDAWNVGDRAAARRALGIPVDATVVGWHGRVAIRQKGLDVLLQAWERLRSARPHRDLRLLLVGTGRDAPALQQLLDAMPRDGISWTNAFVHERDVLHRHLAALDVYAFPSRHEGCPVSLLEAMASGLPVVASDAPGVVDIVGPDDAAGIVVAQNRPDEIAAALARVVDDCERRRQMGVAARRRAEASFGLDAVGRQLRDFMVDQRVQAAQ